MPKAKKKVTKKGVRKEVSKNNLSKGLVSKWYVISSFAVPLILLFIYFIDYSFASSIISDIIGFIVLIWFFVNIFMIFSFVIKKSGWKAISLSLAYIIYFISIYYNNSIIAAEMFSNIEFALIIFMLILSLSIIHKKEYS